jgi:putative transposase
VIALVRVALQLLADGLRFVALTFRASRTLQAEILFLRRQLALYQERGVKPRRPDVATRVSLALLSRLVDWRASLVVVRPRRSSVGTERAFGCCGA